MGKIYYKKNTKYTLRHIIKIINGKSNFINWCAAIRFCECLPNSSGVKKVR
jgi:hypothetical protein